MKYAREIVHQGVRAGVAVRLEQHVNVSEAAGARGGQGRPDFGGMMAVIVDHGYAPFGAAYLKAAVDAAEPGQAFTNRFDRDFEFQSDGDRGGGVENVMGARDV